MAIFMRAMMGLIDAIQAGIALGNLMSDSDSSNSFQNLMQAAHINVWSDIIANNGLNSGQVTLAGMAEAAGGEYISSVDASSFSGETYVSVIRGSADGMAAISESIDIAGNAVSHAVGEGIKGVAKFVGGRFDGLV